MNNNTVTSGLTASDYADACPDLGLTPKEQKEHDRLKLHWATRKATKGEILRCMELDRRAL